MHRLRSGVTSFLLVSLLGVSCVCNADAVTDRGLEHAAQGRAAEPISGCPRPTFLRCRDVALAVREVCVLQQEHLKVAARRDFFEKEINVLAHSFSFSGFLLQKKMEHIGLGCLRVRSPSQRRLVDLSNLHCRPKLEAASLGRQTIRNI